MIKKLINVEMYILKKIMFYNLGHGYIRLWLCQVMLGYGYGWVYGYAWDHRVKILS